jgi:ATP-binding cassette, subfamily B, bacterial
VDVGTEAAIMQAIEILMRGRTTFMIAHRQSTLEKCDLRLRLENGRLVNVKSNVRTVHAETLPAAASTQPYD